MAFWERGAELGRRLDGRFLSRDGDCVCLLQVVLIHALVALEALQSLLPLIRMLRPTTSSNFVL